MKILDNLTVVKVGTSTQIETLADGKERLDMTSLGRIGQQVVARHEQGQNTLLISSGAIAAGMAAVGLSTRPKKDTAMHELQRLASIGWRHNLNAWDGVLNGLTIGGVLLTKRELDLEDERQELIAVTHTMVNHGDIVIANENDVISHSEIAVGDNDSLAALYAAKLAGSGLFGTVNLVLLTDVDGLYRDISAKDSLIGVVDDLSQYQHLAGEAGSDKGTGGMRTKFAAAKIAGEAGINMWIANGRADNVIERAMTGETGTLFAAMELVR